MVIRLMARVDSFLCCLFNHDDFVVIEIKVIRRRLYIYDNYLIDFIE